MDPASDLTMADIARDMPSWTLNPEAVRSITPNVGGGGRGTWWLAPPALPDKSGLSGYQNHLWRAITQNKTFVPSLTLKVLTIVLPAALAT
jgi:hypothetical protein